MTDTLPEWLHLIDATPADDGDDAPADPQCEEFASVDDARRHLEEYGSYDVAIWPA